MNVITGKNIGIKQGTSYMRLNPEEVVRTSVGNERKIDFVCRVLGGKAVAEVLKSTFTDLTNVDRIQYLEVLDMLVATAKANENKI